MSTGLTDQIMDYLAQTCNGLLVDTVEVSISFSNQRYKLITESVAKTGYTPIGIVGWSFSSVDIMLAQCYLSGTTATVYVFRDVSGTLSSKVTLSILYLKNA